MKTKTGTMTATKHFQIAMRLRLARELLHDAAMEVLTDFPVTSRIGKLAERVASWNGQAATLRSVLDGRYYVENPEAKHSPYYGAMLRGDVDGLNSQIEQVISAMNAKPGGVDAECSPNT